MGFSTYVDPVGKTNGYHAETCKVCSETVKCEYSVEQNYFAILFPLFPTKRTVYRICPKCNARLKVKPTDEVYNWVNTSIPKKLKFKYIWGIFMYVILACLVWYFYINVIKSPGHK